jgi:hypothetical protein
VTDEEISQIERRCAAATSGPWQSFIGGRDHISGSSFIRTAGDDIELPGGFHTDQDFIAHARQDIPVLTAEIRCLKVIVG